jgi:AcrR family transcriptional regulator
MTATESPPAPRPARPAPHATAARLVASARAMLDEQGLEGLTLRAIARRAHVSHGAPLKHFRSLAALLAAVAAGGFRDLIAAVDEQLTRLPAGADARVRLAAAGRGYVAFATANPGVFNLMFRPERLASEDRDYVAAAAASFGQLEGLVAAAQAEGFRADVDSTRLASVVWTTVHGLADLWLRGGGLPGADATFGLDDFVALSQSIVLGEPAGRPTTGPRRRTS